MTDLGKCSDRLLAIGPPPAEAKDSKQLRQVDAALHRACPHYVNVSQTVLDAVEMLSSGREDVVAEGDKTLASAGPDSRRPRRPIRKQFKWPRTRPASKLREASSRPPRKEGEHVKLRPDEITSILKERIEQYDVETDLAEVGTVLQIGDGIARIYGLENAVAMDLLELEHGVVGLAFNLERTTSARPCSATGSK